MENKKAHRRLEKRRKKIERRRIEKEIAKKDAFKVRKIELFIKIGIISILALIVVDFFVSMYPIFSTTEMSFELASGLFFVMQGLGILFGLGLFFAGKRMRRDTGIYGGMFQIDGSIIATISLTIFLIVNPLRYTQEDLIINSLYFGLDTVSSFSLLIFSIMCAFFFILVGSDIQQQKQPFSIKYVIMITGILWLVELFIPAFAPSPYADPVVYSIISGITWVVYGLTAYCFLKILYDYEALKPSPAASYRIK